MSDRPINCFRCGADGHFARNCTQCTLYNTQPTTLATTADNQDTSQEIAPKPKLKKTTTTTITDLNVKPPNVTTVVVSDTSPETAAQVHPSPS